MNTERGLGIWKEESEGFLCGETEISGSGEISGCSSSVEKCRELELDFSAPDMALELLMLLLLH